MCGLEFGNEAELTAAGLEPRWLVTDADPNDYYPGFDEDLLYEAWRRPSEPKEDERSYSER